MRQARCSRKDPVALALGPGRSACPLRPRNAVSTESYSAPELAGLDHHEAIDHGLDRVLAALVEASISSSDRTISPSTRRRTKPWALRASASRSSRCSPLRLVSSGAISTSGSLPEAEPRARARSARRSGPARACRTGVAVLDSDPRIEHPQVVGDLGDRADGRARVRPRGLLLDRDRRGQAADRVVAGLLHLAQELPRVGGQGLHVAPLPFRVEGVEGERRLAGTRRLRSAPRASSSGSCSSIGLQIVLARALDVIQMVQLDRLHVTRFTMPRRSALPRELHSLHAPR